MINCFDGEYRWLSNFWPCYVQLDGEWYNSVEAAYVAAKTLDEEKRAEIRRMEYPGQIKRFGRTLKLRHDWETVKVSIMLELLRQKFKKDSDWGNKLVATENQMIVEGNTWGDTFWGVCNGKGKNMLGKLLMQIRNEIT